MTITYMKCKVYTWAMWMSLVVSERLSAGPILGIPPIIVLANVRRTNTRLQSARTQASAIKIPEQKAFWNGMKFRHAFISMPWCTCVLNGPIPFLNFPRLSVNIINNKKTRGKNALTDWCVVNAEERRWWVTFQKDSLFPSPKNIILYFLFSMNFPLPSRNKMEMNAFLSTW